jgi:choline dehydrogenase-like flavoprotein
MYFSDPGRIPGRKANVPRAVIIGAGTIGLYAASLLAKRGQEAVVIEAGDAQLGKYGTDTFQSLGKAHTGIRLGRSRNLGGTSSLWGGQLVEFSPIDFAGRDWLPGSKWPITYEQIAPYYEPTYLNLEIPRKLIKDEEVWRGLMAKCPDLGPDFEVFLTRWMGTPNFAELFARQIQSDAKLLVLLSHTATGFRGTGSRIEAVRVIDSRNRADWIEGDRFLLAAGTIENARLLLHSANDQSWQAPWRDNRNVGLYFQDHLGGRLGAFIPIDKRAFFDSFANIAYAAHKFQPKVRMQNEAQASRRMYGTQGFFAFESEFSEHLVFLKQFLRAALYNRKLTGFGNALRNGAGSAGLLFLLMWKYVWDHRVFVPSNARIFMLTQAEHAAGADSRISVDYSATDSAGLPRVILDWRINGDELVSLRDFAARIRDAFLSAGVGELKIDPDLVALNPAFLDKLGDTYHQAGGAVMGTSKDDGVVDKDLLVFGTQNLYVGGASVFRTASHANVTFTALAFATRLVDQLTNISNLKEVSQLASVEEDSLGCTKPKGQA